MTELLTVLTDICRAQTEELLDLQNRTEYARMMQKELDRQRSEEREADNG